MRASRTVTLLLGAGLTAASLAGCVSAADTQAGSAPAALNPTPNASPRCDLFTTEVLAKLLNVKYSEAILDPASTDSLTQCQWAAVNQESLVITKVINKNPVFIFRESKINSERSLGKVDDINVPGATAAYSVPSLGRTAMVVGEEFIEVSVLLPTATPKMIVGAAVIAANNAR